jgi:pSer/pThr/pTyr-binding forkhead associated (FHA) protein
MSLQRLIFYSALVGGWAAFLGWLASEVAFLHRSREVTEVALVLTAALVGAAIGAGLNLLGGLASGRTRFLFLRILPGLLGGFLGGAVGGWLGNFLYSLYPSVWLRALGWMMMGLGIGSVEGLYDRSWKKIRNGLIGGALGGLLGGVLFDPILLLVKSPMSSRAAAFVLLGLCIGLLVGLAQVVLREAWLTVVEGYRAGRQLILNQDVTAMGTSEKAQLPFIAFGAQGVDPIHVLVVRYDDGSFGARDNNSRTGIRINDESVRGEMRLQNGDEITLGRNIVRFNERFRSAEAGARKKPSQRRPSRPRQTPEQELPQAIPLGLPVNAPPPPSAIRNALPPTKPTPPLPVGKAVSSPPPRPVATDRPNDGVRAIPPQPQPASQKLAQNQKACPICGLVATAAPGKRHYCENCELPF